MRKRKDERENEKERERARKSEERERSVGPASSPLDSSLVPVHKYTSVSLPGSFSDPPQL
jgi:hypothetical protein